MASEIAQVHKLTTLLAERVEFLADLACSRHGYMDQVKTRATAKADKKGLKRRAGDDPLEATLETASVPATSGAHTSPMDVDDAVWGATSASSSTTRAPMSVDSATAKGPCTTEGAQPIPRDLANDILAAIPLLPNEWPLVKIDLILQNTDKYYMSWRRFLFVHELLRAFNENTAVAALRTNATRLVEHLVEFLSEWIVTFVEPARDVTKIRDPELLFLHEKDSWFRAIWQDLHLAATLDRVKSRDRPPVGLVRCICKDARSKGEEGTGSWNPVKLGVSNVHIFVPIWMVPEPVRHVRLLASRDIPPKTKGWVEYKEGWFEIKRSGATAESTLCGMQIHYGDQHIDQFPTDDWRLIERFAQEGILKQEVWSSRLQWLGVKAKIEIPLSGTGFTTSGRLLCALKICQRAGQWIRKVPGENGIVKMISLFRTLLHICEKRALLMTFLKVMKIQKLSAGWQCSMNSGPKGTWIMPTYGKGILFRSCHPNLGTKSHSHSWRRSSALHEAKVNFECHLAPSWNYCIVKVIWALPLRNSGSSMNGVTRPLS